ncbi:hypothetical protein ACIRP0_13635 [Streptomyces sp. NPDC101733]|uniref:hypothetical protein n=1 Tax=unclassified Streptomyces TaxID=2593676 RepID=UPI003816349B
MTETQTDRDRRAFVAPLVSTLLTLPLALVAVFFAGISPMACDACGTEESRAFTDSFETAWPLLMSGLLLAGVLLVADWSLPWRRANAGRRVALALAAPGTVLVAVATFWALLDWPPL